jgi:hypothetical protein
MGWIPHYSRWEIKQAGFLDGRAENAAHAGLWQIIYEPGIGMFQIR